MWARILPLIFLCSALPSAGRASASGALPSPAGMVRIPEGAYLPLQSSPGTPQAIRVPAFYLDIRPVTNGDFLAFVRANSDWRRSRASPLFTDPGYLGDWVSDLDPGPSAPAGSPVVRVSWFAARAYARWCGKRLPTIAEWERAALAGFRLEKGLDDPSYREAALGWFSVPTPAPLPAAGVGRPNIYGARDMIDLVWEWVDDFNAAPPPEGGSCGGAAAGVRDFSNYPAFMRAAFRSSLRASYSVPNLGFRCALNEGSVRSLNSP